MRTTTLLAACAASSSCTPSQGADGALPPGGTDTAAEVSDSGAPVVDSADPTTEVTAECWARKVTTWEAAAVDVEAEVAEFDPVTLLQTRSELDVGADGRPDSVWEAAYEASGEPSWTRYDLDADGDDDLVVSYDYDADGLLVLADLDLVIDDRHDEVWTYQNVDGRRRGAQVDEGRDGVLDVVYVYQRDAADRVARVEGDRGIDGVIDEIHTYTYANPTTDDHAYTVDDDADGEAEETGTAAFDEEGREIEHTEVRSDGSAEWVFTTFGPPVPGDETLSAHGTVQDRGGDAYDWTETYTYESPGRISRMELTYVIGGREGETYVQTWTWSCP